MSGISLPDIDTLKTQAKRLRATLDEGGRALGHGEALELVARQYGYRDWNTLHAAAGTRPRPALQVGGTVRGFYLGQPFTGKVVGMQALSRSGRHKITLHFDRPVDVVTFTSFSAYRQRVTGVIDTNGRSAEKTSNGWPVLEVFAAD